MQSLINTKVQPFTAQAFHNGKFVEVSEKSLHGKWSVLIFMPSLSPSITSARSFPFT